MSGGEMTAARISEIRARAEAAAAERWLVAYDGTEHSVSTAEFIVSTADFTAHARADIPDLLAALEAAEARADRAEAERDHWRDLAVSHAVERDALRRTLADLLPGMAGREGAG